MKIKTQDKITLFSAMLVGIITGSYLYLVGFAPNFENTDVDSADESAEFMIVGEMYGGMRAGIPPSFQLSGDGTYRYIPFSENPELPALAREGVYPRTDFRTLENILLGSDLVLQSQTMTPEVCAQMFDGVEYRYLIVMDGAEYRLDTCGTNFTSDSELGTALTQVFEYLAAESESVE